MIFKGYLPFGRDERLNAWVDYGLKIKRKDFVPQLEDHSQTLVNQAKACAEQAGRTYEYRQGKFNKQAFIQKQIQQDRLGEGLVAVLCTQETCRTVKLVHGRKRPRLIFTRRPQHGTVRRLAVFT